MSTDEAAPDLQPRRRRNDVPSWDLFVGIGLGAVLGYAIAETRARSTIDAALRRGLGLPAPADPAQQPPPMEALVAQLGEVSLRATTDPMTGLGNRQRIMAQLVAAVDTAKTNGAWLAVAMMDLDHFKDLNDAHGHPAGDAVLLQIAQEVQAALLAGESMGRYGGEEFLVVMPRIDLGEAERRADSLRQVVEQTVVSLPDAATIATTASFGAAATYGTRCRVDALLAAADRALYAAKAAGRNTVRVGNLGVTPASAEPSEPLGRDILADKLS